MDKYTVNPDRLYILNYVIEFDECYFNKLLMNK